MAGSLARLKPVAASGGFDTWIDLPPEPARELFDRLLHLLLVREHSCEQIPYSIEPRQRVADVELFRRSRGVTSFHVSGVATGAPDTPASHTELKWFYPPQSAPSRNRPAPFLASTPFAAW